MLSRAAESLYWMARYMERAEDVARIVDVNLSLQLDRPDNAAEQWRPMLAIGELEELYDSLGVGSATEDVLHFMSFRTENPSSILSCLSLARENARSVREIISSEMWEQVNSTYLEVIDAAETGWWRKQPHRFFQRVRIGSQAYTGVCSATMTHGEGWHFLRLGELLERADETSRILDVKYHFLLPRGAEDVGGSLDQIQWASVLKSVSGYEMFRKRFHDAIRPASVASFLLLDTEFPRAVRYCLVRAENALRSLPGASAEPPNDAVRLLGRLRSEFDYKAVAEVFAQGLHEFCDSVQARLAAVGDAIHRTYFALEASS